MIFAEWRVPAFFGSRVDERSSVPVSKVPAARISRCLSRFSFVLAKLYLTQRRLFDCLLQQRGLKEQLRLSRGLIRLQDEARITHAGSGSRGIRPR